MKLKISIWKVANPIKLFNQFVLVVDHSIVVDHSQAAVQSEHFFVKKKLPLKDIKHPEPVLNFTEYFIYRLNSKS